MSGENQRSSEIAPLPAVPAPFVWPPLPPGPAPGGSPAPASIPSRAPDPSPARGSSAIEFLRRIEAFWLAPVASPLARRIEELGWKPDDFDEYCNRCGGDVGPGEEDEFGCARCRQWKHPWSRFVRLGAYEGDLASWIKEVKFTRHAPLGVALGRVLAARLREAGLPGERVCVVPVGMSLRRRWARGIDHAGVIGEGVALGLGAPLVRGLRRSHRASQRRQESRAARERNAKGSFTLRGGIDLGGWTVVLVDDVSTTGATLRAASRALRARRREGRPESIWAATLGVTPERRRGAPAGGCA
ncbi:MAG: ComF family protein [Phycisphaeraceae bacterium]|nr:ComF family protein [Phycisphaeraceae bacterium]